MQLEVLQRKENPLLKRVEVTFKATHKAEPTPTRDALRAFLAKELKATKDIVVIDFQASTFGRYETVGAAKVYKTKEEALAVERKHILVRNKLIEPEVKKEAAPKPEKPAAAPKAEKPEKPVAPPKPEAPKAEAKPEPTPEKAAPKEEKKPPARRPGPCGPRGHSSRRFLRSQRHRPGARRRRILDVEHDRGPDGRQPRNEPVSGQRERASPDISERECRRNPDDSGEGHDREPGQHFVPNSPLHAAG